MAYCIYCKAQPSILGDYLCEICDERFTEGLPKPKAKPPAQPPAQPLVEDFCE